MTELAERNNRRRNQSRKNILRTCVCNRDSLQAVSVLGAWSLEAEFRSLEPGVWGWNLGLRVWVQGLELGSGVWSPEPGA